MNIWAKMITALRGGLEDSNESMSDSQALRILDQEVRDASEELKQHKAHLAEVISHQKHAEKKCADLKQQVEVYEGYALQALSKNDEPLALEIAEKVADLENQLSSEKETQQSNLDN